ncbi:MAG: 4-(cytidine 5'-diphospho)-2-C-methyl-D-erythritol kinase [Eubacteriaceae bacterium]|nr:4-(cytidine 5'-diphospho)-2-C-methyl-D-erythritol kinase [Eubacteriaceae bacterium]
MKEIMIKAYGKINLSLDVLGVMDNGFHQVDMVMHMVDLHDDVFVKWEEKNAGGLEIMLDPGRQDLPADENNLAYKAAVSVKEKYRPSISGTLKIRIEKRIPVAAGLAGGSGNGAAVLVALNRLWDLGLSVEELCSIGAELGADMAFSVMGTAKMNENSGLSGDPMASTCARATGTGTDLEPLPAYPAGVVLSKPNISVSTKTVYEGIDKVHIAEHPDIDEQVQGIKEKDWGKIKRNMINVLENHTLKRYDIVVYTKNNMQNACSKGAVLMSGSGPTVFALFHDRAEQEEVYMKMKRINEETYNIETVNGEKNNA